MKHKKVCLFIHGNCDAVGNKADGIRESRTSVGWSFIWCTVSRHVSSFMTYTTFQYSVIKRKRRNKKKT